MTIRRSARLQGKAATSENKGGNAKPVGNKGENAKKARPHADCVGTSKKGGGKRKTKNQRVEENPNCLLFHCNVVGCGFLTAVDPRKVWMFEKDYRADTNNPYVEQTVLPTPKLKQLNGFKKMQAHLRKHTTNGELGK